jgi:hypothetical protein
MDGIWIKDAASFDGYDKSTTREGQCHLDNDIGQKDTGD